MEDYQAEKTKSILFLSGITFEDYESIEDRLDNQRLQLLYDESGSLKYDNSKLLKCDNLELLKCGDLNMLKDNKIESYSAINYSDLCCWNCTFMFNHEPIFIPTHIKESANNKLIFGQKGIMCSFNCAMSVIIDLTNDKSQKRWKYVNNLKILYFIKKGIHIYDIKPAPSKILLKKFGGPWTNEVFLQELQKIKKTEDHNYKLMSHTCDNIPEILSECDRIDYIYDNIQYKNQIHTQKICDDETSKYDKNVIILNNKSNICLSMCSNEYINILINSE
jgi:hypothetical protein